MKIKLIAIMAVLILGVTAYFVWIAPSPSGSNPTQLAPGPVNVQGEIACLPKKSSAMQTEECAIGLKGNDGNYYGLLDLKQEDIISGKFGTGVKVSVSGDLTEEPMSVYAIAGNISVKAIVAD